MEIPKSEDNYLTYTIFAVISGSAVNNDGANKVGFSAPSVDGQASIISMAQVSTLISRGSDDYVKSDVRK